jgi:hypothetical protein
MRSPSALRTHFLSRLDYVPATRTATRGGDIQSRKDSDGHLTSCRNSALSCASTNWLRAVGSRFGAVSHGVRWRPDLIGQTAGRARRACGQVKPGLPD